LPDNAGTVTYYELHKWSYTKNQLVDYRKHRGKTKLIEPLRLTINHLLANPYWTRLWIVQEVLLAERITLQWSSSKIAWPALKKFVEYSQGWKGVLPGPTVIKLSRYQWVSNNRRYDLSWMLQNFCEHQCADSRDKVFGMLAVVKSVQVSEKFEADYAQDTTTVFALTALHLLKLMEFGPVENGEPHQSKRWVSIVGKLRIAMLPSDSENRRYIGRRVMQDINNYRYEVQTNSLISSAKREHTAIETLCQLFGVPLSQDTLAQWKNRVPAAEDGLLPGGWTNWLLNAWRPFAASTPHDQSFVPDVKWPCVFGRFAIVPGNTAAH
jgi:hypothetical protein